MITHKFYLRTSRTNKSGECALYFLINTKPQTWVATGVFIPAAAWNQKKQQLLPCFPDYHNINSEISAAKAKADKYLLKLQHEIKSFSANDFIAAVITGDTDQVFNPLLTDLITEYLEVNKLSPGRERHYEVFQREIKELKPGIRIKEVDYLFAVAYEKYCIKKANCKNTIATKMRRLKAVVHFAERKKLIAEDPLKAYRITAGKSNRVALTQTEFLKLQEISRTRQGLPAKLLPALDCFVFCCYTGLRYGDIKTLKVTDIKNGYIRIDMHKTGLPASIPVIDPAMKLLDIQPDGRCFRVLTNEPFNRYLKEIADYTGIYKKLSTKVARHTYATISLGIGIPLKVISEILGHTTVKTTEIYTSVYDEMKSEEMNKWQRLTA